MTDRELIATLQKAAESVAWNIPLAILLKMATERVEELVDELAEEKCK